MKQARQLEHFLNLVDMFLTRVAEGRNSVSAGSYTSQPSSAQSVAERRTSSGRRSGHTRRTPRTTSSVRMRSAPASMPSTR